MRGSLIIIRRRKASEGWARGNPAKYPDGPDGGCGRMEFENRIKKEMIKAIIRALLDLTGYRVHGVKEITREVTPTACAEYLRLPDSIP